MSINEDFDKAAAGMRAEYTAIRLALDDAQRYADECEVALSATKSGDVHRLLRVEKAAIALVENFAAETRGLAISGPLAALWHDLKLALKGGAVESRAGSGGTTGQRDAGTDGGERSPESSIPSTPTTDGPQSNG